VDELVLGAAPRTAAAAAPAASPPAPAEITPPLATATR
jgi:hypothetical protein